MLINLLYLCNYYFNHNKNLIINATVFVTSSPKCIKYIVLLYNHIILNTQLLKICKVFLLTNGDFLPPTHGPTYHCKRHVYIMLNVNYVYIYIIYIYILTHINIIYWLIQYNCAYTIE